MFRRSLVFVVLVHLLASAWSWASPTSSPITKARDFTIYEDPQFYCAFPSLVVRPDNSILCAFRRAPNRRLLWEGNYSHTDANSYLVTVESGDGGASWSKPRLMFAHPLGGSQDPCMLQLNDRSILCMSYGWAAVPDKKLKAMPDTIQHPGYGFLGGYVLRSDDGGGSWKGPFVPMHLANDVTSDVLGRPAATFNRGAPLQLVDGRILWAVVRVDRAGKMGTRLTSVHAIESTDRGETWKYLCPIAEDTKITFNETSLIQTAGGDVVAFLRTDGFDGKLAVARSRDGGKSFEKWQDGVFFGHPFHALCLPDGRIFLVYGYRKAPFGVRARVLNADATDFASAPEFIIRDDGGGVDVGYPWAGLLPDGNVMVAYYFNKQDGPRHIAGSVLRVGQ